MEDLIERAYRRSQGISVEAVTARIREKDEVHRLKNESGPTCKKKPIKTQQRSSGQADVVLTAPRTSPMRKFSLVVYVTLLWLSLPVGISLPVWLISEKSEELSTPALTICVAVSLFYYGIVWSFFNKLGESSKGYTFLERLAGGFWWPFSLVGFVVLLLWKVSRETYARVSRS